MTVVPDTSFLEKRLFDMKYLSEAGLFFFLLERMME